MSPRTAHVRTQRRSAGGPIRNPPRRSPAAAKLPRRPEKHQTGCGQAGKRLQIDLLWSSRRDPGTDRLLRRVARYVAQAERFVGGRLCIRVVGSRTMAALHERYRGRKESTDVLTFDLGTQRRWGWLEGDIAICAQVARRSVGGSVGARDTGGRLLSDRAAVRRELALYVAHGILHLAGYKDQTASGFRRMHAREDVLLERLGLGRVFARRSTG